MTGGIFDGLFTNGETREQRQNRKEKLLRSAERLAKGMRPEAGQDVIDAAEIALYGHLLIDMETREE